MYHRTLCICSVCFFYQPNISTLCFLFPTLVAASELTLVIWALAFLNTLQCIFKPYTHNSRAPARALLCSLAFVQLVGPL